MTEEKLIRLLRKNWDWALVALFSHAGLGAFALDLPGRFPKALLFAAFLWLLYAVGRRAP